MEEKNTQADRIRRYADLIRRQSGKAVRPFRADGYVNMMNRYGTSSDVSEHYQFVAEPAVPDDTLMQFYENSGLFAKIIDTPAEEAIKHGFELEGLTDEKLIDFYTEALDELNWEDVAMSGIKWARLFGGAIAVLLVNDGRGLDEPLDWQNIKSIDSIRVYDRSLIQPDYESMFQYDPRDPFDTRGSRLGMPEYYQVFSRYGDFIVHESRCLVFQNGVLPERTSNSIYQVWGIPEYVRIKRALKDAELAYQSAPKLLDRSVQPIYKMRDLAAELATEEGEDKVLRRLQIIDMARGILNSIAIDSEGEDYDFKSFQFSGVNDVVNASCSMLSAVTNIPQMILFGQGTGGLSSTDDTSMENYYNFVNRIQKRMLKNNLRYLLSVIFQAGVATGEVDEVPKLNVEFNPLWSLSDAEVADLELKKVQLQQTRAQVAQIYVEMQAIDPSEVRKKLADSDEFDVETMLDEYDDEDLMAAMQGVEDPGDAEGAEGSASANAPAATKLPQDMTDEEISNLDDEVSPKAAQGAENEDKDVGNKTTSKEVMGRSVGVIVVSDGKVLTGTRHNDFGYGLICGPGGHVEGDESLEDAAIRETEEEFGIKPTTLMELGEGPYEPDTGLTPVLYLCTEYEGEPECTDLEMTGAKFRSLEELSNLEASMFQPFKDGVDMLKEILGGDDPDVPESNMDGGPGSGNFNHEGRPGAVGGSASGNGSIKYSSKAEYEKAKKTATAWLDKKNTSISKKFSKERDELDEKYGNRMLRSIEIRQDQTLSDDEKEEKLNSLKEEFREKADLMRDISERESKELDKVDQQYRSVYSPEYELDKIEGSLGFRENASVVNPTGLTQNCQRCAVAYEMRQRGYDAIASDGEADELGMPYNIARCFVGADTKAISNDSNITNSVISQMKSYGNGARAVVCAQYNGYGHAFNYENRNGEIFVIDPQIGAVWSDKTSIEAGGRANMNVDDAVHVLLVRTDNVPVGLSTEKYIQNRGGK